MNQNNSRVEKIVDDFITRFSVNIADVKTTKELAKYWIRKTLLELNETHHQELQKAREEERERILALAEDVEIFTAFGYDTSTVQMIDPQKIQSELDQPTH